MWTQLLSSILFLSLTSVANAANRITALEWLEGVLSSPGVAAYKTLLYEANDYIGPFTEEYIAHIYQADSHKISMDIICGYNANNVKSAFEYVDYYLRLARLYYVSPEADDLLWEDGAMGKLKNYRIIDLINEIHALELFEILVNSLPDVLCISKSCPSSKDKIECIDSYRQIGRLMQTWVRFIGTQQAEICNGTVVFDSTAVESTVNSNVSLALANVYLHKSLLPFLQDHMCTAYYAAQSAWNLTFVASYVSDFVTVADVSPLGDTSFSSVTTTSPPPPPRLTPSPASTEETLSLKSSIPDQLHVVDRAFNYSASYEDCFAIVGKYKALPSIDEVHNCHTFIRDFMSLPGDEQDPTTKIQEIKGGGIFTTAIMACVTLKSNLSASSCHVAGDHHQHEYIIGLFTTAMAFASEEYMDKARTTRVLNLGLGGGITHTFQRIFFPHFDVETVEIDRNAVEIYRRYFDGEKFVCSVSELSDSESLTAAGCNSRVVIADGWQYVQHLVAMLPAPPALHDMYYDLITTDTFTALTTTWQFESDVHLNGVSNVFVEAALQSLPLLHELIRPRTGLIVLHFHMDGRFKELLQAIIEVFSENQMIYIQTGYDVLIVLAKDRFGDEPGQIPHPCNGHLLEFAQHMMEFGQSVGYSRKWQHRYKYSVRCHWQEDIFS